MERRNRVGGVEGGGLDMEDMKIKQAPCFWGDIRHSRSQKHLANEFTSHHRMPSTREETSSASF